MSTATRNTAEQLQDAFSEFESVSRLLSSSYAALQAQVQRLTGELGQARRERAARDAENARLAARMDNLLDALPGGVVVLDKRGLVQQSNPAARELLGDIRCGEAWSDIAARAFSPRHDDGHDISLANGRVVNLATQALGGEPGQILLLSEVTETRRLHDQLAHHKRLSEKTEMAAALAHQVRTPLATALLHARNLTRTSDEARRRRAADQTVAALGRLERLVEDMLLFARGGKLEFETVAAADVLETIARASVDAGFGHDFDLSFDPLSDDIVVRVNRHALTSIALNLVDNARQACLAATRDTTQRGGRLHIGARVAGARLELRFTDDGPGIAAAGAASIFEPFYTTRANGTGLGLAVARAVARAHGGDLSLETPARGACFVLALPLAATDAAAHTG